MPSKDTIHMYSPYLHSFFFLTQIVHVKKSSSTVVLKKPAKILALSSDIPLLPRSIALYILLETQRILAISF